MRIPPSVIVMSLLTAAPFGLAIRDTLTTKAPVLEEEDFDYSGRGEARRDREALAEYEAERARELEESAEKRQQNVARLDKLFDPTTPARMGSLLEGVMLGATPANAAPERAQARIDREAQDGFLSVDFNTDTNRLQSVTVTVIDDRHYDSDVGVVDLCKTLDEKLRAAWGPSAGGVWMNPATNERAVLDQSACTLSFERALTAVDWLTAVPLDAIGKNAEKYFATYDASFKTPFTEFDEELARWKLPGIGAGRGQTAYSAFFDAGKIVGVRIIADTDPDTVVAVREALTAKLKSPPKYDEDTETWTWKRARVSLTQYSGSSSFIVMIGKDPYE